MDQSVNPRIASLDGLRALAFLAVFGTHLSVKFLTGGGVGVELFFTLSGFIITSILLSDSGDSGRLHFGYFYVRRFVRLTPPLVAMVVVVVIVTFIQLRHNHPFMHETLSGLPSVLTYTQNWVRATNGGTGLGMFAHTWSLGVEEQFYLAWPALVWLSHRRWDRRGVLYLSLFGALVALILRCALYNGGAGAARVYYGADTQMDLLLLGSALAVALLLWPRAIARASRLSVVPGVTFLSYVVAAHPEGQFRHTWGLTVVGLSSCALIAYLVTYPTGRVSRVLGSAPLAWLGSISYAAYLWHYPVNIVVNNLMVPSTFATVLVLGSTLLLADASARLIERPIQRWRDRRMPASHLSVQLLPIH